MNKLYTKTGNDYQELLSREFYEKCPKAVFAALAAGYLLNHKGINPNNVELDLRAEWRTLHENGIVPQKPPK